MGSLYPSRTKVAHCGLLYIIENAITLCWAAIQPNETEWKRETGSPPCFTIHIYRYVYIIMYENIVRAIGAATTEAAMCTFLHVHGGSLFICLCWTTRQWHRVRRPTDGRQGRGRRNFNDWSSGESDVAVQLCINFTAHAPLLCI